MIRDDHRRLRCLVAAAAALLSGSVASAQNANEEKAPVFIPSQPVRQQAPPRMGGLGGVRSQPGVRSAAPAPISIPTFGRPISPVPTMDRPTHPSTPNRVVESPALPGVQIVPVMRDGADISRSHRDGPFTLNFTSGRRPTFLLPRNGYVIPIYTGGYGAVLPYGGIGGYFTNDALISAAFYSTYSPSSSLPPIDTQPPAEPMVSEAPPVLTPEQRAAQHLKAGDAKGAVKLYQAVLRQHPNDADSTRSLGLALLDSGRTSDGIAVIGMAYRSDATLPERPISPDAFQNGATRLRQNLNRVSSFANKEQSGTAWFVLATLMQAEGRPKQALAMLDRAKSAGIDSQVADELASALNGGS